MKRPFRTIVRLPLRVFVSARPSSRGFRSLQIRQFTSHQTITGLSKSPHFRGLFEASDQCAATDHQRDRDRASVLQGDARPTGDDRHLVFVYEPRKLPRMLSPEEVLRLLAAAPGPKHKAALSVARKRKPDCAGAFGHSSGRASGER